MSGLPAISLWQPYASLIALGVKPYETRHWAPSVRYKGQRFAIHAAKRAIRLDDFGPETLRALRLSVGVPLSDLPLGCVVCTATLADVLPVEKVKADLWGDYSLGRFAWHFTDIKPLHPPAPALGHQSIWTWTP